MKESGQTMILVAVMMLVIVLFMLYLIVNASGWFNAGRATQQALNRAANDGAAKLVWTGGLPLTTVANPNQPQLPTAASRHCLEPAEARAATLASLRQNLDWASTLYVTNDGAPLSPTQVVSDTSGAYLIELKAVNPPGLNCPHTDYPPTYPVGAVYPYQQPYVHLAVRLPMKAFFWKYQVAPVYVVDVTSAIDPTGGN
jgi:hypothetical protein